MIKVLIITAIVIALGFVGLYSVFLYVKRNNRFL